MRWFGWFRDPEKPDVRIEMYSGTMTVPAEDVATILPILLAQGFELEDGVWKRPLLTIMERK
jgi:hypothetical protein